MTGTAQNKLGELFVDVSIGGLGKTLKGLNSISASFLLTKNAALQAVKPFINIGKEAVNSAVGIGKMAAALGTTTINAQKLQYYLKQYKAEGLEGDISSLQNTFTRIQKGYGGIDGQMAMSMGQLGLDWQNYSGSFEDTLKFVQDVKDALKRSNLSDNEQLMHLQNLGLGNWKYLFEKEDFDINKSLNISNSTIQNLQKADEEINQLKNNIDQLKKNVVNTILKHGGQAAIQDANAIFDGNKKAGHRTFNRAAGTLAGLEVGALGFAGGPFVGGITTILGGTAGFFGNEKLMEYIEKKNNKTYLPPATNISTGGTAGIDEYITPPMPTAAMADMNTTINITNNNSITGANAQEIQTEIIDIDVQDIQYAQYQAHNQAGI